MADPEGPLTWADQLFLGTVGRIRDGGGKVPRDLVLRMCGISALIGIGYEIRALRKAMEAGDG